MRRLPRLQRLRALPQPSLAQAPLRHLTTTRAAPIRQTGGRADDKQRQEVLEALERDRQSALRLAETEGVSEADAEAPALADTSIVVPPDFSYAPPPKETGDYVPAQSAEGLEEVGGLEGWWDVEGHLGEADRLRVFPERAAADRVTEPRVLEVLVRQAVVEGLVVQGKEAAMLMGRWGALDKAAMVRAGGVDVKVAENGDVTLTGDLGAVLEGLKEDPEQAETTSETRPQENAAEQQGAPEQAAEQEASAEQTEPAADEALTAEEAKEMIKSWDNSWRKVPLTDPALKFAVHKRIYQLTGHRLPDAKLAPLRTAQHLLAKLTGPAKPRKVLEEIQSPRGRGGELLNLPNVKVYGRRVTPIDKEVWVGRWKVIEEELRKRGLPVTGTGPYGKAREKDWLMGKP